MSYPYWLHRHNKCLSWAPRRQRNQLGSSKKQKTKACILNAEITKWGRRARSHKKKINRNRRLCLPGFLLQEMQDGFPPLGVLLCQPSKSVHKCDSPTKLLLPWLAEMTFCHRSSRGDPPLFYLAPFHMLSQQHPTGSFPPDSYSGPWSGEDSVERSQSWPCPHDTRQLNMIAMLWDETMGRHAYHTTAAKYKVFVI